VAYLKEIKREFDNLLKNLKDFYLQELVKDEIPLTTQLLTENTGDKESVRDLI
jgi:Holliday junction resolvase RusA-like endonuclease